MTPITITIPASVTQPGVKVCSYVGIYFLVTALSGAFRVETNNGDQYSFSETNSGFGDDLSPTFSRLNFYNDTGAPVTVTFYASRSPIKLSDSNITSTVTVTQAPISNTLAGCALEAEGQIQKNTAGGGAAVAFAPAGTYFRRATIIAQNTLDRGVNAGKIYIGIGAAHQPIVLNPGDDWSLEADTGGKRDLGSWYVSADNGGDGISILYV